MQLTLNSIFNLLSAILCAQLYTDLDLVSLEKQITRKKHFKALLDTAAHLLSIVKKILIIINSLGLKYKK